MEMYEGDHICRCWGKVAGKEDVWSEFYSFRKMRRETCSWEECWEKYGKVLSKRHNRHGSVTNNFDSMNHWKVTCIKDKDDVTVGLTGPSIGEVIGGPNKDPSNPSGDGDEEIPADFGPDILIPEQRNDMKDDDGPMTDDFEDDEELLEEDLEAEEEDEDVAPKTCQECKERQAGGENHACGPPLCPDDGAEDKEVKDPAGDNNQPTGNKPKPEATNPKDCSSRTPPDVCNCIKQHEGDSWKKNEYSQTTAAIGNCICNLENGGDGWVKEDGKYCMGRTMQAMRELGRFACKLQKYNAHGNKQRCHPAYPGKDVTGDIARATFD